jgi:AraC-like DNA-binding protein
VQLGAAYFYACHAELVEAIVPVQLDGSTAAYVLIGPLFLAPADAFLADEIVGKLSCFHIPESSVRREIECIPVVEAERLKRCLNLLSELLSVASAEPDAALKEGSAGEAKEDTPDAPVGPGRSYRQRKGPAGAPAKQRFILARARLGNLAETRQDVGELLLQNAGWQCDAEIARAAALQTVSALWRAAVEEDGSNLQIDSRNLALSELFKAQTYRDILDWTVAAARRVARNSTAVCRETRARLKKVQAYTHHSLTKKLSCEDVARAVGVTARELEGTLRDHFGIGFRLFLTMERLSLARKLLRESDLTATEIAARTGFTDQSNFTKSFVRLEGITPIQYRVNTARNAASLDPGQRWGGRNSPP